MDFGGWGAGTPPHIAGAGPLAAQNAMSIQARKSRGDTYIHILNTHILNQDILDAVNLEYIALIGRANGAALTPALKSRNAAHSEYLC